MYALTIFAITIISFFLGYFTGRGKIKEETIRETVEGIKDRLDSNPVGVVHRPTQQDILKRQQPKIEEGKAEFKKLLDKVIKK